VWVCARHIDAELWVAQHQDELTDEQEARDAQLTKLQRCKATLGMERVTAINHEWTSHLAFARAS
jgi:hypothetical protein